MPVPISRDGGAEAAGAELMSKIPFPGMHDIERGAKIIRNWLEQPGRVVHRMKKERADGIGFGVTLPSDTTVYVWFADRAARFDDARDLAFNGLVRSRCLDDDAGEGYYAVTGYGEVLPNAPVWSDVMDP